jgi:hypothetical protein
MSVPAKFQFVTKVAAIAATLLFLPLSAGFVLHALLPSPVVSWFVLPPMFVITSMGQVPWTLCLVLLMGMLAIIAAWRHVKQRWLRALLFAGLLSMAAFPFLYRYQPAVTAAPGHQLLLVTGPDSFCDHVRRQSETFWEIRRCEYEIIGWDEDERLFYKARCDGDSEQLWAYQPDARTGPEPAAAIPDTLYPIVSLPEAIDYVQADVYPPSAEESVRRLSFPPPWSVSPTGHWVAAVARHVYGPEDVIVVSTSERQTQRR